jgi:hypothetical protein
MLVSSAELSSLSPSMQAGGAELVEMIPELASLRSLALAVR